jgi:branched-chain amino acid transport system substrate-binding protein
VSPLTAAGSSSADAVLPVVVLPPTCIATAKAIIQLGISKPVVGASLCATSEIKKALGDYPKWTFESSNLSLDAPDSTGQVAFYKAAMARYAGPNAQLSVGAPAAFGAAFALAKIRNTVGADKLSPRAIAAGAKAFEGPVLLGEPKLKFGSIKGMPTVGSLGARFYAYEGGGKWTSKSDWLNLPQ